MKNTQHGNGNYQRVPVLGQAAAGQSVEYLPTLKWRDVRLPSWAQPFDRFVVVEACGNSLTGAGILDGDFVLVHLTDKITLGQDLCAVLFNGAIFLKYVFLEDNGRVRLEGRGMRKVCLCDPEQIEIQGKVVQIIPAT